MGGKTDLVVFVSTDIEPLVGEIVLPFSQQFNIRYVDNLSEPDLAEKCSGIIILAEESLVNEDLYVSLHNRNKILLCLIIPEKNIHTGYKFIERGAFDIITKECLSHLPVAIAKATREMHRHQLVEGLSLEAELFSRMAENSRSMFTIIDDSYRYIKVNDLFCKAHQLNGNDIIGKTMPEVWGDERFNKYIKGNIETCFGGKTIVYHSAFDIPSGGNRHFEVVMRPVKKEGDSITHILCETFDITEITLASETASNLKSDFSKLEAHLPIGYLRTSVSGNIIHANKSLTGLLGYENPSDLNGLQLRSFYADPELFDLHAERLLEEGVISYNKFNLVKCNNKEIVCRISGFLTSGEHNEGTVCFDFSVEDITREIELEERLNQADKMETIGSLAGGIAHDFNNILGTVFGYSELILDELPEGDVSRNHIEKILTAVSRARSLINQMLAFSRQSGQECVPVNAAVVLDETIEFLKIGKGADTTISFTAPEEPVIVYADPTQLFRVFLNILVNAFQAAAGCSESRVQIALERIDDNQIPPSSMVKRITHRFARISITDNGCGIEENVIGHIFEPFYTTKSTGKGTGLGLSVVHGIILELGGDINVASVRGEGTTFSIYLPEFSGTEITESKPEKPLNIILLAKPGPEGTILKIALENLGHKTTLANNSSEIREATEKKTERPAEAIIFVDDDDWDERSDVIAELRSGLFLSIPIIVIAEGEYLTAEENLLNLNERCQHILKPVSLREVNFALKNCLSFV